MYSSAASVMRGHHDRSNARSFCRFSAISSTPSSVILLQPDSDNTVKCGSEWTVKRKECRKRRQFSVECWHIRWELIHKAMREPKRARCEECYVTEIKKWNLSTLDVVGVFFFGKTSSSSSSSTESHSLFLLSPLPQQPASERVILKSSRTSGGRWIINKQIFIHFRALSTLVHSAIKFFFDIHLTLIGCEACDALSSTWDETKENKFARIITNIHYAVICQLPARVQP